MSYFFNVIDHSEIDKRLAAIGKDRAWLAENTPYSADYIRTVLAPNSKRRTERVMEIISLAIEREESAITATLQQTSASQTADPLPDRITLEIPSTTHDLWSSVANSKGKMLKTWAIDELNAAAEEWHQSRQLRVAEHPTEYQVHPGTSSGTAGKTNSGR